MTRNNNDFDKFFLLIFITIILVIAYYFFVKNPFEFKNIQKSIGDSDQSSTTIPEEPTQSSIPKTSDDDYSFSGSSIQLAWFYKPPENNDLEALFENFDKIILTHKDEYERDQLMALGVDTPILQYLRFDAIMDPGDCTTDPWGNHVAFTPGDYCLISEIHPDWFLLDINGVRLYDRENFVLMDPGNQGWREYWLEKVILMQEEYGWNGVFLDNVEASLERHKMNGGLLAYQTESSYISAVEGFLNFIYQSYFQIQGRPLYANIISLSDPQIYYRYLNSLDGVMIEAWAVGWQNEYRFTDRWESQLEIAEKTQKMNKEIILVSQGNQEDFVRQQFAFASYLLITEGKTFFRYSLSDHHQQIWLYPNYDYDLGVPLGHRYKENETWKRDFSNGYVIVDPKTHESEINLYEINK